MIATTQRMLALGTLLCASTAYAQTPTRLSSIPLQRFQDSLGVNIHIEYTDGKYADASQVLADLQYIGIHNVRDAVPNNTWLPQGQGLSAMKMLAANGIRYDFLTSCGMYSTGTVLQTLDSLAKAYPGVVLSVEGANEINNWPCTQGGGSNQQNATNWQRELYSAVHGDSNLKNVPVLYMTGAAPIANMSGLADQLNTHPYPYQGVQPHARLMQDFGTLFPEARYAKQITETGYSTQISGNPDGVNDEVQGINSLNEYFDAAYEGNQRTYLYQLLEAYNDSSSDTHYGMFNYDGSPKIIAQALHNIAQAIPQDKPSAPKTVMADLMGLPKTAQVLATTASDGTIYIWAWNEATDWNAGNQSEISVPNISYKVYMPGNWTVQYFSPTTSGPVDSPYKESDGAYPAVLSAFPTAMIFHPVK